MVYNNLGELLDTIKNSQLSIIIASTKDCNVCVAIKPRLQELLSKYKQVESIYVFVDSLEEATGEFMVFTVPTIILFAQGKEVHRESRFIDFARLEFELSRWSEYIIQ